MTNRYQDFFPERVNCRVPGLSYAADMALGTPLRVEFGTPATSSGSAVGTWTLATAAQTITTGLPVTMTERWGRVLQMSGNGTAANATVTVNGRDYLNQRMSETFVLVSTTAQAGDKAFKYVDSVVAGSNANATDILRVGTRDEFGLPYSAVALVSSLMNGETAGAHTLVVRDATSPATATTDDPRGTITLSTAANGTRTFAAVVVLDTSQLHGIAHYAA